MHYHRTRPTHSSLFSDAVGGCTIEAELHGLSSGTTETLGVLQFLRDCNAKTNRYVTMCTDLHRRQLARQRGAARRPAHASPGLARGTGQAPTTAAALPPAGEMCWRMPGWVESGLGGTSSPPGDWSLACPRPPCRTGSMNMHSPRPAHHLAATAKASGSREADGGASKATWGPSASMGGMPPGVPTCPHRGRPAAVGSQPQSSRSQQAVGAEGRGLPSR